jgi:hypothetical protein
MENIDRKNFFKTIGKGALIVALSSALPIKFFSKAAHLSRQSNPKIKIHPSAVKRNKA